MNCQEASIQISLHVGDDLPAADVPALESHLERCAICESEYESYASARDALFLIKDEFSGSTSLWAEIDAQMDQEGQLGPRKSAGRAWYRHPMFASAVAAALMIGITSPLWKSASLGSSSPAELAENAALSGTGFSLGDGMPGVGEDAVGPVAHEVPEVESVPLQEAFDFMERNQGKGLLFEDADPNNPLIAVPVSNPNRGSY
ncbi:MAG: anti-sigma factor family protein [Planctomycetota bacterium]